MSQAFDPYGKLLGMPLHGRAPDDWELLGIERAERDHGRIADAYHQRLAILKAFEVGTYADEAQQLIEEVSNAYHRLTSGQPQDTGPPLTTVSPAPTKTPADSTVIERPPVAEQPPIAPRTPPPQTAARTLPPMPPLDHVVTDAKVVASGQAQERPVAERRSPSPMGLAKPVAAPAEDSSQSAVVAEEAVGPPQRRNPVAAAPRKSVPRRRSLGASLLDAASNAFSRCRQLARAIDCAVSEDYRIVSRVVVYFILPTVLLCLVGWAGVAYVRVSREAAQIKQEALDSVPVVQSAQRAARALFRTKFRSASYLRGEKRAVEGTAALKAEDYALAQSRFAEAVTAFGECPADADAANALGDAQEAWNSARSAADLGLLQKHARRQFEAADRTAAMAAAKVAAKAYEESAALYRTSLDQLDQAVTAAAAARKRAEDEPTAARQRVQETAPVVEKAHADTAEALEADGADQKPSSVATALNWLARHQLPDGHWSLDHHQSVCKDASCTGPGNTSDDMGATALGLLPYLAAAQTHQTRGPYQKTITDGLAWIMRRQKPDGDLRAGANMYAQGLATMCLCEAYGLTGDRALGYAAQAAINFIERAQNKKTGGWRYAPGDEGDTSVLTWQVLALKTGTMAGLTVDPGIWDGAKRFLQSVSQNDGAAFAYTPGGRASPTMTAAGLLCSQYLGANRDEVRISRGIELLMVHAPDKEVTRNVYYWHYATQVIHNVGGPNWDTWNRAIRRRLLEEQEKQVGLCAAGSWDPAKPTSDLWGHTGGRLMMTSLSALTLEVYYR